MKRPLLTNIKIPAKRSKRSDIDLTRVKQPIDSLDIIKKIHHQLSTEGTDRTRVLLTSYDPTNPNEMNTAMDILKTYGFVKLNLRKKYDYASGSHDFNDPPIKPYLKAFYDRLKTVFHDVYNLSINNESSILNGRKNRNNVVWPSSLNIGRVGPVHLIRKRHPGTVVDTQPISTEITQLQQIVNLNSSSKPGQTVVVDPVNQSTAAYLLKAYFCYEVFAELLGDSRILTSVEPTTLVFPPLINKPIPKDTKSKLSKRNGLTLDPDNDQPSGPTGSYSTAPLTRLVYGPGVLSKDGDNDQNTNNPDQDEPESLVQSDELDYSILDHNKYCGILSITSGDCVNLVPGAHEVFTDLLRYMRETRHTDKRTMFPSTPPEGLQLESKMIRIPLGYGDYLIYDRRLPTKTSTISDEFMKTRSNTFESSAHVEPFIGLNVSFFSAGNLSERDIALRSFSFMWKRLGSNLKVFGHVENVKRRGLPVIVDENKVDTNISWIYQPRTTVDKIVRKIVGLDSWAQDPTEYGHNVDNFVDVGQ